MLLLATITLITSNACHLSAQPDLQPTLPYLSALAEEVQDSGEILPQLTCVREILLLVLPSEKLNRDGLEEQTRLQEQYNLGIAEYCNEKHELVSSLVDFKIPEGASKNTFVVDGTKRFIIDAKKVRWLATLALYYAAGNNEGDSELIEIARSCKTDTGALQSLKGLCYCVWSRTENKSRNPNELLVQLDELARPGGGQEDAIRFAAIYAANVIVQSPKYSNVSLDISSILDSIVAFFEEFSPEQIAEFIREFNDLGNVQNSEIDDNGKFSEVGNGISIEADAVSLTENILKTFNVNLDPAPKPRPTIVLISGGLGFVFLAFLLAAAFKIFLKRRFPLPSTEQCGKLLLNAFGTVGSVYEYAIEEYGIEAVESMGAAGDDFAQRFAEWAKQNGFLRKLLERVERRKHESKIFDVFLSHNSKNKPIVRKLARSLKQRGLTVWLDEWELRPGLPWQAELGKVVTTARSAAVLVGKDGLGPWVVPEMQACINEFVERKMPVIPVLLPGAGKQPELPVFLKAFTWVDLRTGLTESNLDNLHWGITGNESFRPDGAESNLSSGDLETPQGSQSPDDKANF